MSTSPNQCQACGCSAAECKGFHVLRASRAAVDAERVQVMEAILCPTCAADWRGSGDYEPAYQFCENCCALVETDCIEMVAKSESTMGAGLPDSRFTTLLLCPACAGTHQGTRQWLLTALGVFFGVLVLYFTVVWLLD